MAIKWVRSLALLVVVLVLDNWDITDRCGDGGGSGGGAMVGMGGRRLLLLLLLLLLVVVVLSPASDIMVDGRKLIMNDGIGSNAILFFMFV